MKLIDIGHNLSLPRIINCNMCEAKIEYDRPDIVEGLMISRDSSYFYSMFGIYCPSCGVFINVPIN